MAARARTESRLPSPGCSAIGMILLADNAALDTPAAISIETRPQPGVVATAAGEPSTVRT